jgi:hypothetical protein
LVLPAVYELLSRGRERSNDKTNENK